MTTREVKQSLRAGRYAWPGGYEKVYVTYDGGILCDPCVRQEWAQICYALRHNLRDGWQIEGVDLIEAPDDLVTCDHCGAVLFDPDA